MKTKIISLMLCFAIVLSSIIPYQLAISYSSDDETLESIGITEVATSSNAVGCDCGNEELILQNHADSCSKKTYVKDICGLDIEELADIYKESDNDIQEFILTYLSWTNQGKLSNLQEMLEKEDSDDNTEDIEIIDRVKFDGAVITADGMEGTETLQVTIPDSVYDLAEDVGVSDLFVADIAVVNAISGEDRSSGSVEINIQIPFEAEETDVIHFIEDASKIRSKTSIMSVEHLSTTSQSLLANAINACYEATGIENAVAVDLFEDTPVIDGTVSVSVDNFSIFAVGDVCVNTYNFYVNGTLKSTQIVIADSINYGTLFEPEAPYIKGKEFLGWKAEGSDTYQKFGSVRIDTSGNIVTNLYAEFSEPYYVYFLYEAREGADILETLSGKTGDVIYTDQVDYPINLDKHVISWHTDIECTSPDVTEVVIGNENIVLYPKVETGFWVTFYTNGGSYIDPMFYGKNETIIAPAEPQKDGYQFIGWLDKDNNLFEFDGQLLTQSCILYASWQPLQVEYTVQIMLQDPNILTDYNPVDTASFKKYIEVNSEVFGASITETELDTLINGLSNSNYFKKNLDFFYLNTEKTQTSKITAAGDGSSVLYVYYDRYPYIINFYLNEADYTSKNLYKSITGYFDAELAFADWPIPLETEVPSFISWYNPGSKTNSPWTGYYNYSTNYLTFDTDNNEWTFDLYAITSSSCTWEISYYLQTLNPDGTVSDVGYTLENDHQMKPNLNALTPTDSSSEIFKKNWNKLEIDNDLGVISDMLVDGSWILYNTSYHASNKAFSFWDDPIAGFTLVAFTMDSFDSNGKKGDEFAVFRVDPRTQAYFAYVDNNITVEGSKPMDSGRWYAISSGIQLKNIFGHVYCRYLRNSYNLEFVAEGQTIDEFDVYFETDLGLDKFVTVYTKLNVPEGYRFEGWYTAPDLSEDSKFDLTKNKMPANDVKLYAKYVPKVVDIDVHITLDGSDTIIDGFNSFTVKYGSVVQRERVDELRPSVEIPEGAIWYGWYEKISVGGGKELLVPFNFDKQLIKDIVLYPFYSYMTPVKIMYNLNGGTGEVPVDEYNYALGRGAVVLSNENVTPPDGKYFIGWNTKADGSGKKYYPGDIAVIDLGDMTLYAQYGTQQDLVTMNYYGNETNEVVTEELLPNSIVTLVDPIETGMFEGKVYENGALTFIGWNTSPDGTGEQYLPGQQIVVTQDGENKLYAIWEHNFTNLKVSTTLRAKALENQSFVYTVIAPDGGRLKVVINIPKGKTYGEVTINNVTPGRYIIANENTWDWRYSDNNETVSITQHAVVSQPNNFDFYESRSFFKWICDCVFKGRKI